MQIKFRYVKFRCIEVTFSKGNVNNDDKSSKNSEYGHRLVCQTAVTVNQSWPRTKCRPELHPRARWTETWQKQRTKVEGGRGEAETTPPISPCTVPVSSCNPSSPISNLHSYRPDLQSTIKPRDEVVIEEPTSSCTTPPLHSQPAYMAVPVIQSPSVQDRPLDYHVPRRPEYSDIEPEETLIQSKYRSTFKP
ncbi:transcriptional regulator ovo [Caerostris extrusa]|uniref:Transcriptional regulator ovo n=1 Tax=Caerostris extrusa TaxID=172846 RepID=A0AAV4SJ02_CAEEX|nr:transcriptional regulator ovo [Caerostris extrusa]